MNKMLVDLLDDNLKDSWRDWVRYSAGKMREDSPPGPGDAVFFQTLMLAQIIIEQKKVRMDGMAIEHHEKPERREVKLSVDADGFLCERVI